MEEKVKTRVFVTGDTHRDFWRIRQGVKEGKIAKGGLVVILGDACLNYFLDYRDAEAKRSLRALPLNFLFIRGNHEMDARRLSTYREEEKLGGKVDIEEEYPNLWFARSGEVYDIVGRRVLVVGGAYSIDKYYRLERNIPYFADEQLCEEDRLEIEKRVESEDIAMIFSHTCPARYIPKELFLDVKLREGQEEENTTEKWLDRVYEKIGGKLERWYCGHWHGDKEVDNVLFMHEEIEELQEKGVVDIWWHKQDCKVELMPERPKQGVIVLHIPTGVEVSSLLWENSRQNVRECFRQLTGNKEVQRYYKKGK